MSDDVKSVMDEIHEAEKAAGITGGGGALFCKARIDFGFKVFAKGQTPHETTFLPLEKFPPVGDEGKQAVAKLYKDAVKVKTELGVDANPAMAYCITVKAEDVYGKAVKWQFIQHKIVPNWKRNNFNGFEEVVIPALVKLNILQPGTRYVKIKYVLDQGKPGEEGKPNLIWVPDAVFKNEAECRKAAEEFYASNVPSGMVESGSADCPEGWDNATWEQYKPDIDTALKVKGPKAKAAIAQIAKDYGISEEWLAAYQARL